MTIVVKEIKTAAFILNEDWEFKCDHDCDTYSDWASEESDPQNSVKVLICESCEEILCEK